MREVHLVDDNNRLKFSDSRRDKKAVDQTGFERRRRDRNYRRQLVQIAGNDLPNCRHSNGRSQKPGPARQHLFDYTALSLRSTEKNVVADRHRRL